MSKPIPRLAAEALSSPGFADAAEENGALIRLSKIQRERLLEVQAELQGREDRKAQKRGKDPKQVTEAQAFEWILHRAWNRIHTLNAYYCDTCGTEARCKTHSHRGESSKLGDMDD